MSKSLQCRALNTSYFIKIMFIKIFFPYFDDLKVLLTVVTCDETAFSATLSWEARSCFRTVIFRESRINFKQNENVC